MTEIWKDVLDYEGLYQVSDLGRVKSLAKKWVAGNGTVREKPETIFKLNKNISGYYSVSLRKNNKMSTNTVHRLVYEAFNGKTDLQIDHIIEGSQTDNRLCNLQAVTCRENLSKSKLSKNKSSQYTGVNWSKSHNKWQSKIQIAKKTVHLGFFTNEIDAANAYKTALSKHEIPPFIG